MPRYVKFFLYILALLVAFDVGLFVNPPRVSAALPAYLGTIPDITGTGAKVALSSTTIYASSIQLTCSTTSLIRVGDVNVSASRGTFCANGSGQYLSPQGPYFDMSTVYAYIPSGDTLSITYVAYNIP